MEATLVEKAALGEVGVEHVEVDEAVDKDPVLTGVVVLVVLGAAVGADVDVARAAIWECRRRGKGRGRGLVPATAAATVGSVEGVSLLAASRWLLGTVADG